MQDFVRIRIADAAEEMRISQRPFQRMVLLRECGAECVTSGGHHVNTAGIEFCNAASPSITCNEARLLAPASVRVSDAGIEIQSGQGAAAIGEFALLAPVQPSGNHQMKDQPYVVVETNGDALADSPQTRSLCVPQLHRSAGVAVRSRNGPAIWTRSSTCPTDALVERFDVNGDVRQFRHRAISNLQF